MDFVVSIVPVDLAGNEGAPQTVRVQDPGDPGGCRIGARRHPRLGTWLLALVALIVGARRRRT